MLSNGVDHASGHVEELVDDSPPVQQPMHVSGGGAINET